MCLTSFACSFTHIFNYSFIYLFPLQIFIEYLECGKHLLCTKDK